MDFLRSIKSVKALGLAAATVATMVTANVAPTLAQTPATRTITFKNAGFYNAEFFVSGRQQTFDGRVTILPTFRSGTKLHLQSASTSYPAFSLITVTARTAHDRKVFFQQNFRLDGNMCFQANGTVFNPSLGRC